MSMGRIILLATLMIGALASATDPLPGAALLRAGQDESATLGCGPEAERHTIVKHKEHPLPQPGTGKVLVYVIWPGSWKFQGTFRLGINGRWVATLQDGMYSFVEVEPGLLSVCWVGVPAVTRKSIIARPSPTSVFRVTAEAGQVHHFQGGTQFGGNPIIEAVSTDRAAQLLSKVRYVTMEPKK